MHARYILPVADFKKLDGTIGKRVLDAFVCIIRAIHG